MDSHTPRASDFVIGLVVWGLIGLGYTAPLWIPLVVALAGFLLGLSL